MGELASLAQQLLATLSVAVAFIGTFVVATVALKQPLPSEVALFAPVVALGTGSALVGVYANSVSHSRIIQCLEAAMGAKRLVGTDTSIARGETLGGLSYGGGGLRNLHFGAIAVLTYVSAFLILAGFICYCMRLGSDRDAVWHVVAVAYAGWWLLLVAAMSRAVSVRRWRFLDKTARDLIAAERTAMEHEDSVEE